MAASLAIEGGTPVREKLLPYGQPTVDDEDIAAVVGALRSPWLTTGPMVAEFERALAREVGAEHTIAVNSGTAALHAIAAALDIGAGDEVIVPAMTFAATATAFLMQGARPIFADVDADNLLIDPASVAARLSPKTRAVVAVDYAGQVAAYARLRELCAGRGIALVADACHSLGARQNGTPVGALADLTAFSFHPVKHIATGEGGAVSTADGALAERTRRFRNHGISVDHRERVTQGSWEYEIASLGYNYRLTDFQCALGVSQLKKLPRLLARRRELAAAYDAAFADMPEVSPLAHGPAADHAFHLYVIRVRGDRRWIYRALRAEGIGVNVHYIPVHLHPLFRDKLGTGPGLCPVAEHAYAQILTLPLFAAMSDGDLRDVVNALQKVLPHAPAAGQ